MPNGAQHNSLNRRGPKPRFTERLVVNVRQDQLQAVDRLATVLQMSRSDLVRLFIDQGTDAVESVPKFKTLSGKEPVPWANEPTQ